MMYTCLFFVVFPTDLETVALEEKNKRDHYTQLVGACLVGHDISVLTSFCLYNYKKWMSNHIEILSG